MPPDIIHRLSQRGAAAGVVLRERFRWDHQLWVRYRSVLGLLQANLDKVRMGYVDNAAARSKLEGLLETPPGYPMSPEQKARAVQLNQGVASLAEAWRTQGGSLESGVPVPVPDLRVRPKG
jgi:hypothetical protein